MGVFLKAAHVEQALFSFYFIYFILFYFILFYFILFYFILFYLFYYFILLIFLKRFYLFMRDTEKERRRDTGRGRSRLHAGSPTPDSIPGLQDHTLG